MSALKLDSGESNASSGTPRPQPNASLDVVGDAHTDRPSPSSLIAPRPPAAGSESCLVLPGTFKSMLHPNTTGDISITIYGLSTLNELMGDARDASALSSAATKSTTLQVASQPAMGFSKSVATLGPSMAHGNIPAATSVTAGRPPPTPPTSSSGTPSPSSSPGLANEPSSLVPPAPSVSTTYLLNSEEVKAKIQLTYRTPSHSGVHDLMTAPSRRLQMTCRGKVNISNILKNQPGPVADGHAISSHQQQSLIKQYDLMFVQSDFQPGQPFFSVTFSKTLVQNTIPVAAGGMDAAMPPSPHHQGNTIQSTDRGLMLSGHYSTLRNYDLGTVRIHLPPGVVSGELAPQFGPQLDAKERRRQVEDEEYSRFYEHLLPYEERNHRMNQSDKVETAPFATSSSHVPNGFPAQGYGHANYGNHGGMSAPNQYGSRSLRFCYGCGETGHLHKDCPRDQLFCYNCNQTGHSSKNCRKPKPWEHQQHVQNAHHPGFPVGGQENMPQGTPYMNTGTPNLRAETGSGFTPNRLSNSSGSRHPANMTPSSSDPWNMTNLANCLNAPSFTPFQHGKNDSGLFAPSNGMESPLVYPAATPSRYPAASWSSQPSTPQQVSQPGPGGSALFPAVHNLESGPMGSPLIMGTPTSLLSSTDSPEGRTKGRCFLCGTFGHVARQCPNGRKCFNCDAFGHSSYECQNPKRKSPATTLDEFDELDDGFDYDSNPFLVR